MPLSTNKIIDCLLKDPEAKFINDQFWFDNFVAREQVDYFNLIQDPKLAYGIRIGAFEIRSSVVTPVSGQIVADSVLLQDGNGQGTGNRAWVKSSVLTSDGAFLTGQMIFSNKVVNSIRKVCK